MDEIEKQAKEYSRSKIRLMVVQLLLTAAFLIFILILKTSVYLRDFVSGWSQNFYIQVGLFFLIFAGIYYLLFIALDFYDDFLLEHKFLLSNQTVPDWLIKSAKKILSSLLMLLIAAELLYFALKYFPNYWWLLVATAWLFLSIVIGKIAPVLIIPLFYKCSPLADGRLKERLLGLGKNCSLKIKNAYEIKLSRETKKANAAVVGFGKSRRILLGDTLLQNFSDDEVEAIFAHELAHIRLYHIWKILGFEVFVSLAAFYLAFLLYRQTLGLFGFSQVYDIAAFPLLLLILMLIGLLFMPVQNVFLRYLEKQADIFAVDHIPNSQSFVSALAKLAKQNLSDPSPSKFVELMLYTHPPIAERLRYVGREEHVKL